VEIIAVGPAARLCTALAAISGMGLVAAVISHIIDEWIL
jgi:hypothetical protein